MFVQPKDDLDLLLAVLIYSLQLIDSIMMFREFNQYQYLQYDLDLVQDQADLYNWIILLMAGIIFVYKCDFFVN